LFGKKWRAVQSKYLSWKFSYRHDKLATMRYIKGERKLIENAVKEVVYKI
jgi:hypothetical protein